MLARLRVLSLRCESISEGEVLRALGLAIDFRALLSWERAAVKDNVWLYLMVA